MNKLKGCIFLFCFCSFFPFCGKSMAGPNSSLYVGILENIKVRDSAFLNVLSNPQVRVAFIKKHNEWFGMPGASDESSLERINKDYPESVKWTIVFDGKKLGNIKSVKIPGELSSYGMIGLQEVVLNGDIPEINIGKKDFSYAEGLSKTRPLVLVSGPNFKDPDLWKPSTPSASEKKLMIPEFRKKVPTVFNCENIDDEKGQHYDYPDKNIAFPKCYRSKKGVLLIDCQLQPYEYKCDGPWPEDGLGHWFVLWPNGKVKYLGAGIHPMDAADLDKCGESEWIFFKSATDPDGNHWGYTLYYDDFSKSAEFGWFYH